MWTAGAVTADVSPTIPSVAAAPPARIRWLGRPRRCNGCDLPTRLQHWHAPRANRWEQLRIEAGTVTLERLWLAGIARLDLHAGDSLWLAPGSRWRVSHVDAAGAFELATCADETSAADAPQSVRAALLDTVPQVRCRRASELHAVLAALAPGEVRLLRASPDCGVALAAAVRTGQRRLLWHPLAAGPEFVALITRAADAVGLVEYMGRDHALIEAVLAAALRGERESAGWLPQVLARHLAIEERLLFPAWQAAGGDAARVHALLAEHADLRWHLPRIAVAASRRRFLLMLDGHDEKEEQQVYPEIVVRLRADTGALASAAIAFALADPSA